MAVYGAYWTAGEGGQAGMTSLLQAKGAPPLRRSRALQRIVVAILCNFVGASCCSLCPAHCLLSVHFHNGATDAEFLRPVEPDSS